MQTEARVFDLGPVALVCFETKTVPVLRERDHEGGIRATLVRSAENHVKDEARLCPCGHDVAAHPLDLAQVNARQILSSTQLRLLNSAQNPNLSKDHVIFVVVNRGEYDQQIADLQHALHQSALSQPHPARQLILISRLNPLELVGRVKGLLHSSRTGCRRLQLFGGGSTPGPGGGV